MAGVRKDLAKLGGPWADEILWYARAVGALRSRSLNDRTGWTYLAAMHGINAQGWIDQQIIPQNTPAPSQDEMRLMFNQCQHAGWFFLPWHRGYLWSFEAIVADWIAQQGGPADWALPYWNYLSETDPGARDVPQEFRDATLPDGSDNPLAKATRGPATALGPQPWIPADINLNAQANDVYTAEPGTLGYGGPISGFSQQGNAFGAAESNPHNFVHVMVGGDSSENPIGWMYDPDFAALDPIFWVHHCNIDRLWEAWLGEFPAAQEQGKPWKNGPFPRQFTVPDATGALQVFIPEETLPGGALVPSYDDLTDGTGIQPGTAGAVMTGSASGGSSALIGANDSALSVTGEPVRTRLALASDGVSAAAADAVPLRVYLNAEGVRGQSPSGVLNVAILAPQADGSKRAVAVETMVFFGLASATSTEGQHAGSGLTATVEITDLVRELGLLDGAGLGELEVEVAQPEGATSPITVDRLSLYAKPA